MVLHTARSGDKKHYISLFKLFN
uniref:Uncharacterized protein n=1 Tax=Arundo donax TaxID=35708 RepID=A0A0A8Y4G4_ARUDO